MSEQRRGKNHVSGSSMRVSLFGVTGVINPPNGSGLVVVPAGAVFAQLLK